MIRWYMPVPSRNVLYVALLTVALLFVLVLIRAEVPRRSFESISGPVVKKVYRPGGITNIIVGNPPSVIPIFHFDQWYVVIQVGQAHRAIYLAREEWEKVEVGDNWNWRDK